MTAEKRKEYEEDLKKLRPIDDIFMREIFRNNIPLIQLVLRIITGISDLIITEEITQYDMKRLLGARSLCLDVLGKDSLDRIYNMEIERSKDGAKPKRARYHSSSMDIEFLDKNQDFDELPTTYTIFITEKDVYGKGKPIYEIERVNKTINEPFNDGEHILYVNGAYENAQDNSDIAKLLHDFRCSDADDMYIDLMADSTRYFKEKSEGADHMCDIIERRANELLNKKIKEVKYERNCEFATDMLKKGKSLEEAAEFSKLPLEKVKELSFQLKNETA